MINPLTAQLLPSVSKTSGAKSPAGAAGRPARPSRPGGEGLADSIMKDGGLGFLRSRLDETMGTLFEKAAEKNPDSVVAASAASFESSTDVTVEATADRIVGFALGLKGIYSRQNSGMSEDEMMAGFEAEIRRGISEGFGNAREILGGLDSFNGQVQENVDATWELVQQKLDEFFNPSEEENHADSN